MMLPADYWQHFLFLENFNCPLGEMKSYGIFLAISDIILYNKRRIRKPGRIAPAGAETDIENREV